MRLKYWALAAVALPVTPAAAQQAAQTPVIVVTGHGLEQTPATPAYDVIELDRDKIVSGSSGRIEDVLLNVAGFQQFRRSDSRSSNPSAQGATLRALGGNASSRALVLLDAVPMLDPFFGYVPFSAIAPERLESIRVTRGGGSGPFGSGALADHESNLARTLAGTRCASGVVQKPWPRSHRPLTIAKPSPSSGATVPDSSVSPRSLIAAAPLSNPIVAASALSSSIAPASAPEPNGPEPPPRVTRIDSSRSGAIAENGT